MRTVYVIQNVKNDRYVCGEGKTTQYPDEAKEWPLLADALRAMAEWDDVGDTLMVVVREIVELPYIAELDNPNELRLSPDLDEDGRLKK